MPNPSEEKRDGGGYDCQFVNPPTELQYECSICLSILRDPCHLDCQCGYSYCRSCIAPVLKSHKPCPLCNKPFKAVIANRMLERELGQRKVSYSNEKLGCEWQGDLKDFDRHLDLHSRGDGYGVPCEYCGTNFKCSLLGHHRTQCNLRPFRCEFCSYKSDFLDVTQNHLPTCTSVRVFCPNNCGLTIQRKNIVSHVANDCPLAVVECELHFAGCEVKAPRKDMAEHISQNAASHVVLQGAYYKKQVEDLDKRITEDQHRHKWQVEELEKRIVEQQQVSDRVHKKQIEVLERRIFRQQEMTDQLHKKDIQMEKRVAEDQHLHKNQVKELEQIIVEQQEASDRLHQEQIEVLERRVLRQQQMNNRVLTDIEHHSQSVEQHFEEELLQIKTRLAEKDKPKSRVWLALGITLVHVVVGIGFVCYIVRDTQMVHQLRMWCWYGTTQMVHQLRKWYILVRYF